MLALLPILLSAAPQTATVSADGATILHENKSGATLTLPPGWSLADGERGLLAMSEDHGALILLVAAEKGFEKAREDVKALILQELDDVTVAKAGFVGLDEAGSLEAIVKAKGSGISKVDGKKVEFSALLVKSGEKGALALGAWKSAAHAETVGLILQGLQVEKSAGKGGLELADAATGARITIPEGWNVAASRKGIIASAPERQAMTVILRWQDDFDASLEKTRNALLWAFKDVSIGKLGVVEASYHESLGRVVAADGKAIDPVDMKPVEFTTLRIQSVDQNQGSAIFGAWKTPKYKKQVEEMLASIEFGELKKPAKKKMKK